MQRTFSLCLAAVIMSTTQAIKVEEGEWEPNACQQKAIDKFEEAIKSCKEPIAADEDDSYQYCEHRAHVVKKHDFNMCWLAADKDFNKCKDKLLKKLKKQEL